jgi:cell division septation protein DedD
MASTDDGVREIQLNGKQLVFLFMAVTVVSVVIFLCGVLVGRGVQTRANATAAASPAAPVDEADDPTAPAVQAPAPGGPTKVTGLEYQDRLVGKGPVKETLAASATQPTTAPASAPSTPTVSPSGDAAIASPASAASAPTTPPPTAVPPRASGVAAAAEAPAAVTPLADTAVSAAMAEPRGDGFAIQVAALKGRGEAEAVVTKLKGKGYSAFLMPPLAGQPSVFRVRVGKFKTRADAEKTATRLEREEQFKPWITR